jgi:hypothetical protein
MPELVIKSADSSASLIFSDIEGDYFTAKFHSPELTVTKRVWGYTDCKLLVNLFEYLAQEWKGWDGEKDWASLEGEFSVSCSSDKKGHVHLKLRFRQYEGREPWIAEPSLNLEAGMLEGVAKNVRKFFLS